MKKLSALILSVVLVLCMASVAAFADESSVAETESVVSVESVVSTEETESAVVEGTTEVVSEIVSEEAVSSETVSYIEAESYQNTVSVIRQIAKHNETVSPIIGTVAWTLAGIGMAGVAAVAIAAYIKYRTRRR